MTPSLCKFFHLDLFKNKMAITECLYSVGVIWLLFGTCFANTSTARVMPTTSNSTQLTSTGFTSTALGSTLPPTTASPTRSTSTGPYFPPTDLKGDISTTGAIHISWKSPPKDKSPTKPMFEVWVAYRNNTNQKVSKYTKIDRTKSTEKVYNLKKVLVTLLKGGKDEKNVGFLLFKVRVMSASKDDKRVGKFSVPLEVSLKKSTSPVKPFVYGPPVNVTANLTRNGTIYVSWNPPLNVKPGKKPVYNVQIAYATNTGSKPSEFSELESTTLTSVEGDIGKLLRQFVDDNEDKLVSFLLFKVRALNSEQKVLTKGKFSTIVKVRIRIAPPSNYTSPRKPKTWIYIVAPLGGIMVALVIILAVYCHRQYRIRKSYMSYIRTQYDTESEALSVSNENFGLDSENQPQIRFSDGDGDGDDESLIVA